MICHECKGRGESTYFVETDRDENTVTVEKRKGICRTCNGSGRQLMTNADRIRAMSDEELGIFLGEWAEKPWTWKRDGEGECLAWLKQPAEEEKTVTEGHR